MPREIEHQWNQPGCKEMEVHFLADGFVNHNSIKISLMQNILDCGSWGWGSAPERQKDVRYCQCGLLKQWIMGKE